jgi:hypothetical protein
MQGKCRKKGDGGPEKNRSFPQPPGVFPVSTRLLEKVEAYGFNLSSPGIFRAIRALAHMETE